MKYLKTFESKENEGRFGEYWHINCKSTPYILVSLSKIGLTPEDDLYKYMSDREADFLMKHLVDYFYVAKHITGMNEIYWDFSTGREYKDKLKYNGVVKVKDWELDAFKYNL